MRILVILVLLFIAGMLVFVWYIIQQGKGTNRAYEERYDQLEQIVNWHKI